MTHSCPAIGESKNSCRKSSAHFAGVGEIIPKGATSTAGAGRRPSMSSQFSAGVRAITLVKLTFSLAAVSPAIPASSAILAGRDSPAAEAPSMAPSAFAPASPSMARSPRSSGSSASPAPSGAATLSSTGYRYHGQCLAMDVLSQTDSWTPTLADSTPAGSYTLLTYRTRYGLVQGPQTFFGVVSPIHKRVSRKNAVIGLGRILGELLNCVGLLPFHQTTIRTRWVSLACGPRPHNRDLAFVRLPQQVQGLVGFAIQRVLVHE